ncbi:MAG: OmpH family outer membrane protein [Burkholderiales bacterium]|nr:OmpH family outer membrane protein [Burkholderiales bacterium]
MKVLRFIALLCLAAAASVASAQEAVRIGVVNIERLMRDAAPAKAAQQKLEAEFSKRDKELQDLAARLKSMSERLERDASVISEADRARRQRELAELDRDFQRRQREFREDLNQRRNEELAQVIDKANRVIKQIAEQEKYDIILQEAVIASARVDITDKVLRALANGKP